MTASAAVPTWVGVALSVLLVVVAGVVVRWARVGLGRDLLIAALRAAVQLAAVGAVLLVLFRHTGLPGALAWVTGMVLLAGQVAGRRAASAPQAALTATVAIAGGSCATLGLLLALGVISTQGRVVVPVGGMVVSGAMQAATLTLRRVAEDAVASRPQIEARLSLGLSAREAFAPSARSALRNALIPSIDATRVVGLISLPGAMTGLILAGVDPLTAIRYQIVVMYMLLASAAITAVAATALATRALFDDAARLRPIPG